LKNGEKERKEGIINVDKVSPPLQHENEPHHPERNSKEKREISSPKRKTPVFSLWRSALALDVLWKGKGTSSFAGGKSPLSLPGRLCVRGKKVETKEREEDPTRQSKSNVDADESRRTDATDGVDEGKKNA